MQEVNADAADKAQQPTASQEAGPGSGGVDATKLQAELPSSLVEGAAEARICPLDLPAAVQDLLHQSIAFMQEQSSVGSEALVSLIVPPRPALHCSLSSISPTASHLRPCLRSPA